MDRTMEIIELQHYESKKWVHEGIIQKCVWDHVFYRAAKSSFLEEIYTVCVSFRSFSLYASCKDIWRTIL